MPNKQEEITHLQKLLRIRWRNLHRLEERAANYGSLHVPTDLANELEQTQAEIKDLENKLAQLQPPATAPLSPSSPPPPNPFGDQGRITDPGRFFGRQELLRQIFEELSKGVNLSLVGRSQIGKSSLLSMVCALAPQRMAPPPESLAYLSLEWVDDEDDFYEALCETLNIKTCRGFKLTRALHGQNYLLCLDEMEKMAWDSFTINLRSHLRGLADGNQAPLKLVIASRSPLNRLFPDSPELDSPLAGICRQLDVGPFSPDTARAFLHHRLRNTGVTFTPPEIENLLTQTNCRPAHLQRAAADLYNQYTTPNPQSPIQNPKHALERSEGSKIQNRIIQNPKSKIRNPDRRS